MNQTRMMLNWLNIRAKHILMDDLSGNFKGKQKAQSS